MKGRSGCFLHSCDFNILPYTECSLFFRFPNFGPKWKPINPNDENLNCLHMKAPGNFKEIFIHNLGEKNFWKTINFNENVPSNTIVTELEDT